MAIPPLNTAFAKLFRTGDVQNFSSTHARKGGCGIQYAKRAGETTCSDMLFMKSEPTFLRLLLNGFYVTFQNVCRQCIRNCICPQAKRVLLWLNICV